MGRRRGAALAATLLLLPVSACGRSGAGGTGQASGGLGAAADISTCLRDGTAVTSYPSGYPSAFPMPRGTVVFHVEDRGADGVIATGVTAAPFHRVLSAMNALQRAGFSRTSGETEEDDAEASWSGHGYVGRWAVEKSATCPGETVVQVLSTRNRGSIRHRADRSSTTGA